MESLLFALEAVAPIILMVIIGYLIKKSGLLAKTVFYISHRLSVARYAYKVIFVDNNTILALVPMKIYSAVVPNIKKCRVHRLNIIQKPLNNVKPAPNYKRKRGGLGKNICR